MFSSEEQETTEKTVALCDSSQAPDSDPALQMSKSQEVSEPSKCSPRKGAQLSPSGSFLVISTGGEDGGWYTASYTRFHDGMVFFCFIH